MVANGRQRGSIFACSVNREWERNWTRSPSLSAPLSLPQNNICRLLSWPFSSLLHVVICAGRVPQSKYCQLVSLPMSPLGVRHKNWQSKLFSADPAFAGMDFFYRAFSYTTNYLISKELTAFLEPKDRHCLSLIASSPKNISRGTSRSLFHPLRRCQTAKAAVAENLGEDKWGWKRSILGKYLPSTLGDFFVDLGILDYIPKLSQSALLFQYHSKFTMTQVRPTWDGNVRWRWLPSSLAEY